MIWPIQMTMKADIPEGRWLNIIVLPCNRSRGQRVNLILVLSSRQAGFSKKAHPREHLIVQLSQIIFRICLTSPINSRFLWLLAGIATTIEM